MQPRNYADNPGLIPDRLRERINSSIRELWSRTDIDIEEETAVFRRMMLEWTAHSIALDGNRMTLKDTDKVINRGIAAGGRRITEIFEAVYHRDAVIQIDHYVKTSQDLTELTLKAVHEALVNPLPGIHDLHRISVLAGHYRTENLTGIPDLPPPPEGRFVAELMDDFFDWYHKYKAVLSLPDLAAWLHMRLMYIQPFGTANGRIARAALNYVLMLNGYPPAIFLRSEKNRYFRTLTQAIEETDYQPYMQYFASVLERSILERLNRKTGREIRPEKPARFSRRSEPTVISGDLITLADAVSYCSFSQEYLSLLARRRKLKAVKKDGIWMTTLQDLEIYIEESARNQNRLKKPPAPRN